jgi:hypothetical protein
VLNVIYWLESTLYGEARSPRIVYLGGQETVEKIDKSLFWNNSSCGL